MDSFDFLSVVQPDDGWFAVVGIKGSERWQEIVETRPEFDEWVNHYVKIGYNVFYGVAKYKDDSSRRKTNVLALKCLWLDLDCGPNKGYANQNLAVSALRNFCRAVGLPKPLLVNSGYGVHVYWPLETPVSREDWEPLAAKLKALCVEHSLHADPSCFDAARILRLPGTFNHKGHKPIPVEVIQVAKAHPVSLFRKVLDVDSEPAPSVPRSGRGLSPLAQQLQANIESSFSRIMRLGVNGCAQLNSCYAERETLSEPRWFDALSIAKFCRDKDKAIHKLSEGHPGYDPELTEQKISHIVGPHTCEVFEANNPGGCAGCPHAGKIKSPIVLGRVTATEESPAEIAVRREDGGEIVYRIPEYPFPYVRGKTGGIYRRVLGEDEEPILVYPYDLYVVKRMRDPVDGGVILIRSHTPRDGVEEFAIATSKISDSKEMRKELARRDILLDPKRFALLEDYIIRSAQELRHTRKAEHMRNQFGWADGDSKFIVGNREIGAEGVFHSPPSAATRALAEYMEPSGTFEKWREVFNLYGRPGLESAAFAAATAFGAPLLKFSGQRGAIINLVNTRSGTGKTTALHMCNSVWGHPEKLCAKKDDTFNSKVFKIGVMNTLPITFDEMSNTDPKQLSELAYLITQGSGKDRMKATVNELRLNNTTWQTIALCSSNHSFYEKLGFIKNDPQGEVMRIIEYNFDNSDIIDIDVGKQMFDHQLLQNYGHAGERYARYIVENYEDVKGLFATIQQKIDTQLKLTPRERFWSATVAANITGIFIASNRLKLFDWDLKPIFKWACQMILGLRTEVAPPLETDAEVLGHFIMGRMDNILIVNDGADRRSALRELPLLEPRQEVIIRYEPDRQRVYISVAAFRRYCAANNIGYRETIKRLKSRGVFMGRELKRMTKGMKLSAPPVQALIFDGTHSDFEALADIVAERENEKNESSGD